MSVLKRGVEKLVVRIGVLSSASLTDQRLGCSSRLACTIASRGSGNFISAGVRWTIGASLVALVSSVIFTLIINIPSDVTASEIRGPEGLRTLVDEDWGHPRWEQAVTKYLVDYLESLRGKTQRNSWLLSASIALQIIGIGSLAASALMIIGRAGI